MMNRQNMIMIAVVATILSAPLFSFAAEKAGDVVSLRGTAVIERQAKKVPAALKAPLLEADNVVTLKRSRIKMLFRDDSVLTLGANSRLIIKKYLYSPENKRAESIYELADGKLRAVVGSEGFKVQTPTAFAAARGTVFITWYDSATDSTGVAVIEGSVSVQSSDPAITGALLLKAGQMTSVPAHRPPGQPAPFNLKTGIEGDADQGNQFSDVTAEGPPDALPPPPHPHVKPGMNAPPIIIIPKPPIVQTPRPDVTRVNLNLQFQ
jgi:hypothetical protein